MPANSSLYADCNKSDTISLYPYTAECNKTVSNYIASKIQQLGMHFEYSKIAQNSLNLASKCRAEFRLPVDIQFVGYSWDFPNQNGMQTGCLSAVFCDLEKCAKLER